MDVMAFENYQNVLIIMESERCVCRPLDYVVRRTQDFLERWNLDRCGRPKLDCYELNLDCCEEQLDCRERKLDYYGR